MKKEKLLIVGGGFGGVKTALELAKDERFHVTLLTDQPDLRYYPTLYHAATGGHYRNSSLPLKRLFENRRVDVLLGTAVNVDKRAKKLSTADGHVLDYDTLVLSLGVVTNYFGIPGLADFSYSIKSQEQAQRLKAHLHQQLIDDGQPDLHYAIVGAGPTGIELAGALPAYLEHLMKNHGIKRRRVHIDLIEASPRLLPRFPRDVSRMVKRRLRRLGIKIYVGQAVQSQTADELTMNGKPIRSHTVIWTAGVTNHPFFKDNGFALTSRGKVSVDAYLQADDSIFVIGDNANTPYSGMAQTAITDAEFLAHNLKRRAGGKDFKGYPVKKPITVIPVGEKWAMVQWGKVRMYGWLGWFLRELGDIKGFLDYEPLPRALQQWSSGFGGEESCPVCQQANKR